MIISKLNYEVTRYLEDSDLTLQSLHRYPLIKQIFLKYNAPTPSSAPVERLFSASGLVRTPRRNKLGDKRFKILLLLKFNLINTQLIDLFYDIY